MLDKSHYDPSRDTVGKIYRDLHMKTDNEPIIVGDMCNELMKGLVEDINDGIAHKPFGDVPWYIMIHEKKDLQMKDALLRRILHFKKRPWPEDDTTVFWHDPIQGETKFCWCLPHWSEMMNMLTCESLYDHSLIEQMKAYRRFDLLHFGFIQDDEGHWQPNPYYKGDKALESFRKAS